MYKNILFLFLAACVLFSCTSDDNDKKPIEQQPLYKNGFFIINEGNFNWQNASLSFYSYDSAKVYKEVFKTVNSRALGDVATSMTVIDTLGFIVVNNSGKVEVISVNTGKSVGTISDLVSPRTLKAVSDKKAYITDLYASKISVLDLATLKITNEIAAFKSTENFVVHNNKAFVTNWSYGNKVQVIDTQKDEIIHEISVVLEPNSIVLDKNNKIWVLSSGGFANDEIPALCRINPETYEIEKEFKFPDKNTSPMALSINANGDKLYYLNTDIFSMTITDDNLPTEPFAEADGRNFYALKVDSKNRLIVSDAINYLKNSNIFIYNSDGSLNTNFEAGIISGNFCLIE